MDWYKLQNGSDIRGEALDGVAGQPVNLTCAVMERIGAAFARYLADTRGVARPRIAMGRDVRLSGEALLAAAAEGAQKQGAHVLDVGLCSTPAMFMTTQDAALRADGAMMLTASHLPYNRNGAKFFTKDGGLEKTDIRAILALAEVGLEDAPARGALEKREFLPVYAAHLRTLICAGVGVREEEGPLAGFRIVVDAGNGAGGFFATDVLAPLGANTAGSQFLEPDGRFPNHAPNPEDEAAMASLARCVWENKADLGVIFDTDVDRAGAVAPDGTELNRNRLIALMAATLLETHPGTAIVTDSITSEGLARFITEKGGVHRRFKRGYRNVINEAVRLNAAGTDCQLAMETSGHGALKENYFLDDGAYLMVKLIIQMARLRRGGKPLMALIDTLAEPAESAELRLSISAADFASYGNGVLNALLGHAEAAGWALAKDNCEGVRARFAKGGGDGWFLLRMSLHDPVMPLNIESDTPGGTKKIAAELYAFLGDFAALDTEPLRRYIKEA